MIGVLAGLAPTAAVVMACMLVLWLVSLAKKDASIVDIFWGPGFVLVAWLTWWQQPGPRALAMAVLVTVFTLLRDRPAPVRAHFG